MFLFLKSVEGKLDFCCFFIKDSGCEEHLLTTEPFFFSFFSVFTNRRYIFSQHDNKYTPGRQIRMKTKHMRIPHKSTCGPHKQDETASLATQTPGLATLNPRIKSHKAFQIRITSPRKHDRAIPQGARRPHACHGAATDPRAGESPKKRKKRHKKQQKNATNHKHSNTAKILPLPPTPSPSRLRHPSSL